MRLPPSERRHQTSNKRHHAMKGIPAPNPKPESKWKGVDFSRPPPASDKARNIFHHPTQQRHVQLRQRPHGKESNALVAAARDKPIALHSTSFQASNMTSIRVPGAYFLASRSRHHNKHRRTILNAVSFKQTSAPQRHQKNAGAVFNLSRGRQIVQLFRGITTNILEIVRLSGGAVGDLVLACTKGVPAPKSKLHYDIVEAQHDLDEIQHEDVDLQEDPPPSYENSIALSKPDHLPTQFGSGLRDSRSIHHARLARTARKIQSHARHPQAGDH